MHSRRMRTTRLLTISRSIRWGSVWMQTPLDADPTLDADPPGHVICDACLEANPPPVNRMTDACENITLSVN